MAHGGYLQLSRDLGVPVRIGVERSETSEAGGKTKASGKVKEAINLFNMFGKAG